MVPVGSPLSPLHAPPPPPAGLLALPGAAPLDSKTPGAHLLPARPRSGQPMSDDAVARRATRHAGGGEQVDDRLLHTDPEAAARHIRALKKQQQQEQALERQASQAGAAAAEGLEAPLALGSQQQEQQQQQVPLAMESQVDEACAAGTAGAAGGVEAPEREVLVESTKENLPEAAAAAAAAVAAATPVADAAAAAAAAAAAKHAKGTLTAVVQQHGGSRLRWEGGAPPAHAAEQQEQAAGEEPAAAAEEQPAAEEEPEAPRVEPSPADLARVERLQAALVQRTQGLVLDNLESIAAKLSRWAWAWPGGALNKAGGATLHTALLPGLISDPSPNPLSSPALPQAGGGPAAGARPRGGGAGGAGGGAGLAGRPPARLASQHCLFSCILPLDPGPDSQVHWTHSLCPAFAFVTLGHRQSTHRSERAALRRCRKPTCRAAPAAPPPATACPSAARRGPGRT